MFTGKKEQCYEISIQDIKSEKGLENLSDEAAESLRQDIIALSDLLASLVLEDRAKKKNHEKDTND